ncbi:HAD-IIB family hydrolase [Affinibrenneria salicis]|uniref:HAD-IIB family hydrolase n=1 Tax=Affinibrenneria salicis TaxID=2590031 RepID=A0A5J5G1S6_9GAMM|nr:HAD-IIB family hydrolase [Affinibrenneria salicis]KAA9000706.1 HAD-IIB family hydrolase [Affinibrenneria salicis]
MLPLSLASNKVFSSVKYVLTDMDETLTLRGRLAAKTYDSLERLQSAGIIVIPVTGAPAGWCDQMVRMWPVDGVIGENGGFFFQRSDHGHSVNRYFCHTDTRHSILEKLQCIAAAIKEKYTWAIISEDQPFRLTSLAFSLPEKTEQIESLLSSLKDAGLKATVNNLWVLGWFGDYDKLIMSRDILKKFYSLDEKSEQDTVFYSGDSENDAPMFEYFTHTLGMNTIRNHLTKISQLPTWISNGPGGDGFVEGVDKILEHQKLK